MCLFIFSTLRSSLDAEALSRDLAKAEAGAAEGRTDHRTGLKTSGAGPEVQRRGAAFYHVPEGAPTAYYVSP